MAENPSPAAELRAAAKAMRERATKALSDGASALPWRISYRPSCGCCLEVTDASDSLILKCDARQAPFIAGWLRFAVAIRIDFGEVPSDGT